jgi:cytoskeleton protein RodZ
VREGDKVVSERTLRPGDIYRVPDRPGLILHTGNGAGFDIEVDGKKAPSLGAAVRRNVALDPARLAAGTALPN